MKDVTVIIRGVGERTQETCHQLVAQQVPEEHIHVIQVQPFSAAVRRGLELGYEAGRKWTLCLDADVLPSPTAIEELLSIGNATPENTFEVQGLVLDKLFSIPRPAGNHLYRTALIPKAYSGIPEEGTSLRPETDMRNFMLKKGYPWLQDKAMVGLHDYEQSYADIFRKCYLQARKHGAVGDQLLALWRDFAETDKDYQACIWGFQAGKLHVGEMRIDKSFLEKDAEESLDAKGWQEKPKQVDVKGLNIATTLAEYQPNEAQQGLIDRFGYTKKKSKKMAFHYRMVWLLGHYLEKIGRRLKKWAK